MCITYTCNNCGTKRYFSKVLEVTCTVCGTPMKKADGPISTDVDTTAETRFMNEEALYGRIEKSMGYRSSISTGR